jgi:hypothetical protein
VEALDTIQGLWYGRPFGILKSQMRANILCGEHAMISSVPKRIYNDEEWFLIQYAQSVKEKLKL